ncbi:MAG TPA: heavy metal-associated domain-containing protein [Bacteroidia bacterium]|nr:heavy metal-associated domain-containing protein [Bacteroidia bacterium]
MKKKIISTIPVIVFMLSFIISSGVKAQTQEIIIQTTAQCGECKHNIEKALMAEKGVKFAELDIKTKQAKVIYNSKKTSPEQLRKAISMVGYDADDVPADPAAVLKLSPCCTKDGHRE